MGNIPKITFHRMHDGITEEVVKPAFKLKSHRLKTICDNGSVLAISLPQSDVDGLFKKSEITETRKRFTETMIELANDLGYEEIVIFVHTRKKPGVSRPFILCHDIHDIVFISMDTVEA